MSLKPGPRPKVPTVTRQPNGGTFTMNKEAFALLTQEGAQYVAITQDARGNVSVHPMIVPRDTVSISKLYNPRTTKATGAHRFSMTNGYCYEPGKRYRCVWDDEAECLRITMEEV